MNGIALFLWIIATSGQIGAAASPPGVKFGWKPEDDGSMSYIAQVTPEIANQMMTPPGMEIKVDIPDFLKGRVQHVVWRIGISDVEREPSQAELQAMPKPVLPGGSQNSLAPGGLTNLNDSAGQTVMIDPQRTGSMTRSTAGVERGAENDPSLIAPPSLLAQNFPPSTGRSGLNGQVEVPGSNTTGLYSTNNGSLGTKQVLPKQDTFPSTSSNSGGLTLPPGYSGSPVTVTGTPANAGTNNGWADSRLSGGSTTYGAGNPISNGTFGNANHFNSGTSNPLGPSNQSGSPFTTSGNFGMPTSNPAPYSPAPYSTAANSPYSNNYPNSNPPFNGLNQPPSGSNPTNPSFYGPNPPSYANGTQRPDALFASNNPNHTSNPAVAAGSGSLGPSYGQGPLQVPAANHSYPAGGNSGSFNGMLTPPLSATPTSQSYIVPLLLLVSFVGNVYLVMLLNQLLQRYRALQASSRGTTSLAM